MNAANPTYRELLELEIGLLNALSTALDNAKAAIASCKIQELEENTVMQRRLCAELESANRQIFRVKPHATAQGSEEGSLAGLRESWRKAHARVQQLNKEVQGVLWRSQRTVNALLNAFRMFEGNYAVEALKQTSGSRAIEERA